MREQPGRLLTAYLAYRPRSDSLRHHLFQRQVELCENLLLAASEMLRIVSELPRAQTPAEMVPLRAEAIRRLLAFRTVVTKAAILLPAPVVPTAMNLYTDTRDYIGSTRPADSQSLSCLDPLLERWGQFLKAARDHLGIDPLSAETRSLFISPIPVAVPVLKVRE